MGPFKRALLLWPACLPRPEEDACHSDMVSHYSSQKMVSLSPLSPFNAALIHTYCIIHHGASTSFVSDFQHERLEKGVDHTAAIARRWYIDTGRHRSIRCIQTLVAETDACVATSQSSVGRRLHRSRVSHEQGLDRGVEARWVVDTTVARTTSVRIRVPLSPALREGRVSRSKFLGCFFYGMQKALNEFVSPGVSDDRLGKFADVFFFLF